MLEKMMGGAGSVGSLSKWNQRKILEISSYVGKTVLGTFS